MMGCFALDTPTGCAILGFMRCIQCGFAEDRVIDSRMSKDGSTIRRRRECRRCQYRYTTYEHIERMELRVLKRDHLREALNREKILRGMIKACEKRPVNMEQLDNAADEIVAELHHDHQREVPSSAIGQKVIEKLYAIDPVAYIRYVSVYRQFQNVEEFIELIRGMEIRTAADPLQRKLPID
ncbi:MAG: transcriptional regulator NrdR [Akkermansia sp.]|nr:transcriptional regulator NrdR [Akkermansia sp.]MCD8070705.1 transcriptional regulator NrdR [Akkermansiaceae bacterium]